MIEGMPMIGQRVVEALCFVGHTVHNYISFDFLLQKSPLSRSKHVCGTSLANLVNLNILVQGFTRNRDIVALVQKKSM
jgi:hypothetical protein